MDHGNITERINVKKKFRTQRNSFYTQNADTYILPFCLLFRISEM